MKQSAKWDTPALGALALVLAVLIGVFGIGAAKLRGAVKAPATYYSENIKADMDKRIADAVSMAKEHWGVFSRLGVEQMLCATFRLNAFAEYSEGNTQDLYRHMGSAYRLGTTLSKSFGDHFSTSLEYQYVRQAKEVYTHGGYTGSYHLYSARRNACSLSLKYKF